MKRNWSFKRILLEESWVYKDNMVNTSHSHQWFEWKMSPTGSKFLNTWLQLRRWGASGGSTSRGFWVHSLTPLPVGLSASCVLENVSAQLSSKATSATTPPCHDGLFPSLSCLGYGVLSRQQKVTNTLINSKPAKRPKLNIHLWQFLKILKIQHRAGEIGKRPRNSWVRESWSSLSEWC